MINPFLEAGKIVNTHGVRGEVKIQPWTNSPDIFRSYKTLYIDGAPMRVASSRLKGDYIIAALDGVSGIDGAALLKGKTVYVDRNDVHLEEGEHFVRDIIGLAVYDTATGNELGRITDVISLPANDVYVISGEREILLPAVPEFIAGIDIEAGRVSVRLIEGM